MESSNKMERELTRSLEDYMRAIYVLSKRNKVVRVKNIAEMLKVKPSSVTFALKKLLKMGLIDYEKRGYVDLTEKGLRVASRLSNRYRSIEHFLENILGLSREIAEIDACNMEHYLHDETIERIEAFVKFVENDPGGAELINRFLKYYRELKC